MSELKKKAIVVMLPTKKQKGHNLWLTKKGAFLIHTTSSRQDELEAFHLYICSQDEIKVGDWFYNGESILQCSRITDTVIDTNGNWSKKKGLFKIMATTDKSLTISAVVNDRLEKGIPLPTVSNSFIGAFICKYNKGEQIKEVMVTWENYMESGHGGEFPSIKLKLRDNKEIIITNVKGSWDKEEVKVLIQRACASGNSVKTQDDLEKWFEQNL